MRVPRFRTTRRLMVPAVAALAAFVLGPFPPAARAALPVIWAFPGNCGGAQTLQECIDQASAGDTIDIVSNGSFNERPLIDKTLLLQNGQGFSPTIALGAQVSLTAGTADVVIRGLRFERSVEVRLTGGSGHSVTLDHLDASTDDGAAVLFDVRVPATLGVESSTLHIPAADSVVYGMDVETSNGTGLVDFRSIGNHVDGHASNVSGPGILVGTSGAGGLSARIMGNSIWSVAKCGCGISAGVALDLSGTGHADVDVVGNTIERSHTEGLYVERDPNSGTATLDVFDNVFSHITQAAIRVDSFGVPGLVFREGFDDRFAVGGPDQFQGPFSDGHGDLTVGPGYVDPALGDLRLKPSSPLVDAGLVCSPGGVAATDAAGHFRLAGPTVDIGAYERGAPPVTGEALVGNAENDALTGTSGADILCGMGGSDSLNGAGGNDYVDGGPAGDTLQGGTGVDTVFGRAGPDQLFGDEGADTLVGGSGPDTLSGGPGNDPCIDSRDGVHGNDHVDGGTGRDGFVGDPGDPASNVELPAACG